MIRRINVQTDRPDIKLYMDVVYKMAPDLTGKKIIPLKCHMILPERGTDKLPLLIWIGGGGWMSSSPERRLTNMVYFAQNGYAVVSIGYRVSTQARWPAQRDDVYDAIRFLAENSESFHLDMKHVFLMGGSAGGQMAAAAALTWADKLAEIRAAVCMYTPFDLTRPLAEDPGQDQTAWGEDDPVTRNAQCDPVTLLLGGDVQKKKDLVRMASPLYLVHDRAPAFLLLHGTKDTLVHHAQSERMYETLEKSGVPAELYLIENAGHASAEFSQPEVQFLILDFLNKNM